MLSCVRVLLVTAQLHWGSSGFSTALPLLLQALALAQQHHLQALASETVLHLTFTQVTTANGEMIMNLNVSESEKNSLHISAGPERSCSLSLLESFTSLSRCSVCD